MKWKSWTLKLKNSITGQRSCQKLQKKSNKIKLRRLLGYVFLTSCVILHGTKSLLLLPGLSFFLTNDSLVTSYLQADLLGIPVIRPADIETIRPHPYELHANSGPTHGTVMKGQIKWPETENRSLYKKMTFQTTVNPECSAVLFGPRMSEDPVGDHPFSLIQWNAALLCF